MLDRPAEFIRMYPQTIQWKADQNANPSLVENSPIVTNLVENVSFIGKVEIKEKDIHHEGKIDSVVASLDNNEIKYTITTDQTTNLNFPNTLPFRVSKGLATCQTYTKGYKEVLNGKLIGGSIGGVLGGSLGFMLSQIFNIDPELCIRSGMTAVAIFSTLLAGGIKPIIEKKIEEQNEIEALNILQSQQGVKEYCQLKIVPETFSFQTNDGSDIVGTKYIIAKDPQAALSKKYLSDAASKYPLKNKKLILKRCGFMHEAQVPVIE